MPDLIGINFCPGLQKQPFRTKVTWPETESQHKAKLKTFFILICFLSFLRMIDGFFKVYGKPAAAATCYVIRDGWKVKSQ
jgi:hypothetical protein